MSSSPANSALAPGRRRSFFKGSSVRGYGTFTPYLLLLPAFAVYAVFLLYPFGQAAQISLYDWNGMTVGTWVGFDNYISLFQDHGLRSAFLHAFILIIFYSIIPLICGLALAAVLNRARVKGLGFFRTIFFLPQVIALVAAATAWSQIYQYKGSLNGLLEAIGLGRFVQDWLGDYTLALPSIGVIGTWVEIGLIVVLLLAGMSRIDNALFEAARLDGAGPFREFFAITLPAIRGEIVVALTLTIIAALKNFDLVYMTTSGGPGGTTTVPSYEVYYRAFIVKQVGLAAAIGITLAVIILIINVAVNQIGSRES